MQINFKTEYQTTKHQGDSLIVSTQITDFTFEEARKVSENTLKLMQCLKDSLQRDLDPEKTGL